MPDPKTVRDWVNTQVPDKDRKGGISEPTIAVFATQAKAYYRKQIGSGIEGTVPVSLSFDATDLKKFSQK